MTLIELDLNITDTMHVSLPDWPGRVAFTSIGPGLSLRPSSRRSHAKSILVNHLLEEFLPGPGRGGARFACKSAVSLCADDLGRPALVSDESGDFAISFSTCEGNLWAALAHGRVSVGLDLSAPWQFSGPYPFSRVSRRGNGTLHLDLHPEAHSMPLHCSGQPKKPWLRPSGSVFIPSIQRRSR